MWWIFLLLFLALIVVTLVIMFSEPEKGLLWYGGGASVSVVDIDDSTLLMQTNMLPAWIPDGGAEVYTLRPGAIDPPEQIQITKATESIENPTPPIVYLPSFGDVGYIGRPHPDLESNTHWGADRTPLEIIALSPMSVEAWDVAAQSAGQDYTGGFRINVHYVALNPEMEHFTRSDGTELGLSNDSFYAHTHPMGGVGEYHLHMAKFAVAFDYSNKVIGYSRFGYPIMGLGTSVYQPIIDNGHATDYIGTNTKLPAVSGYRIRSDYVATRQSLNTTAPVSDPGIFHLDYEWLDDHTDTNTWCLDKYNMGYIDLEGEVVKAFVMTASYPYLIHTNYSAS
jgi:hypothetical protein